MAAVVLVDMAQAVQFVWAGSGARTRDASTLSKGTRLLIDFVPQLRYRGTNHFLRRSAAFEVGNEAALFDFGGFGANIRVSQVLW